MTSNPQARHVRAVLRQCTAHEYRRGKAWYPKAYQWCTMVGQRYNMPANQVAGIVAALSPQVSWVRNLAIAREFIACGGSRNVGQTGDNIRKAKRILQGEAPLTVLGGAKVRAFWQSIVGDASALCCDRHAYSLAYGRNLSDLELARLFKAKKRQLATRRAYEIVAKEYGLDLPQLQAITWLAWRRIKKEV